jgi:hypothetical protein
LTELYAVSSVFVPILVCDGVLVIWHLASQVIAVARDGFEGQTKICDAICDQIKELFLYFDGNQNSEKLQAWLSAPRAPSNTNFASKLLFLVRGKLIAKF